MEQQSTPLPYREKLAWLYILSIVLTLGPYFVFASNHEPKMGTLASMEQLKIFAIAAIAKALIALFGNLALRIHDPAEARVPLDERDIMIMNKSIKTAYFVLMAGTIITGAMMPFTTGGWEIVNAAIFMVAIAELVQNGITVYCYRRQS